MGAGVIGQAAAWRLAGRGVAVTVVDPDPSRGASHVAAGMLAPVAETHYGEEDRLALLLEAARLWPSFAAEVEAASGMGVGLLTEGTLTVALDASDRAWLDDLVSLHEQLGLPVSRRSGRECRELVPALAPAVSAGAETPLDHQVDNRRLLRALERAGHVAGVRRVARRAERVLLVAGAAAGVGLDDGAEVLADVVVVAAGAWTSRLGGVPEGVFPPVRPVKGHVLRLSAGRPGPFLARTVRGLVHGRSCYLVPRADGTVVIGATVEERGFDHLVEAGAVHQLLHDARALVPGTDELSLTECSAGLRPGSPDNAPFVGWSELPGLAVATGHYRNGILLAPLTAEAVADLVAGEDPGAAWAPFGATRCSREP